MTELSEGAKSILYDLRRMYVSGFRVVGEDISGWGEGSVFKFFYGAQFLPELIRAGLVEGHATGCYHIVEGAT